jgi:uncharacterized membrane protein
VVSLASQVELGAIAAIDSIDLAAAIDLSYLWRMRLRHHDSLQKTLSFAAIHLMIAVAVGYALTGSFVLAGLLSLIEPAINTVAHYHLDRRWRTPHLLRKTLAFGAAHLVVSVGVGYALTGSFVLAGLFAFIEPALNTMAHYAFERWWARVSRNVVAESATAGVGD